MSEKKSFVLRLNAQSYEALEKWAADEFRSVNGQLEYIIENALKAAKRQKPNAKSQMPKAKSQKPKAKTPPKFPSNFPDNRGLILVFAHGKV